MRFLSTLLGVAIGAALLFTAGAPDARGDRPADARAAAVSVVAADPAPAVPGTDAEARDYAQREALSPEAQEFVGGHGTLWGLLVFVAVVLLIVYLAKNI